MAKPILMYYVRHEAGEGAIAAAVAIANALCHRFEVVLLTDALPPDGIYVDPRIELSQLPPMRGQLPAEVEVRSAARQSDITRRGSMLLERYARIKPDVVVIDEFPVGDPDALGVLMPMLDRVRFSVATPPPVVTRLIDLHAARRVEASRAVDDAAGLLNDYFNALLVHSDSGFGRLEEFFQPKNVLSIPVFHTGFVAAPCECAPSSDTRVIVSLDGSIDHGRLVRAALDAYSLLRDVNSIHMTLVVGERVHDRDWQQWAARAENDRRLELWRTLPNRSKAFCDASWAVCHCDYEALRDVTAAGIRAVFVPLDDDPASEQFDRGWRLAMCGVGSLAMAQHLNGASLASYLQKLIAGPAEPVRVDREGAQVSANVIYRVHLAEQGSASGPDIEADFLSGHSNPAP